MFTLQGVVTKGGTGFFEALASGDLFADLRFDVFDTTCRFSDFPGTITRDDDDAIGEPRMPLRRAALARMSPQLEIPSTPPAITSTRSSVVICSTTGVIR